MSPAVFVRHVAGTATSLFPVALLTFATAAFIVAYGAIRVPGGYDGSGGLNVTFGLVATVWALGFSARCANPHSKLAAAVEALALFVGLSLIGSLASEGLALGSGPYVDPELAAIDGTILPFIDWRDVAVGLPVYPQLRALFAQFYVALNWQAFLFLGAALMFGGQRDMEALLTALSVALLICVLPFHWLPGLGPYAYYGIAPEDIHGASVMLPWDFPAKLEGLRNGQIDTIGLDGVSGLISMPSFHACSAVIFAWAFWRYRLLRWPMLLINVLMFVSAVPIGGHYFIDVIAGGAAGGLAIMAARALERRRRGNAAPGAHVIPAGPSLA